MKSTHLLAASLLVTVFMILSAQADELPARDTVAPLWPVSAGASYQPVVATDRQGGRVALADVLATNKVVLLEFWASWCKPCRADFPRLKALREKYRGKGFEIYALSVDKEPRAWLKALDEERTPWINVVDHGEFDGDAAKAYGVLGVPTGFLITADGVIRASHLEARGDRLEKILESLLGETSADVPFPAKALLQ